MLSRVGHYNHLLTSPLASTSLHSMGCQLGFLKHGFQPSIFQLRLTTWTLIIQRMKPELLSLTCWPSVTRPQLSTCISHQIHTAANICPSLQLKCSAEHPGPGLFSYTSLLEFSILLSAKWEFTIICAVPSGSRFISLCVEHPCHLCIFTLQSFHRSPTSFRKPPTTSPSKVSLHLGLTIRDL